jgi:hypothetical protein
MPTRSLTTLLSGLIDYAGLFPPAKLSMQHAVEAYARARVGEHEWMLCRFICPAARLRELSQTAAVLMPGTNATSGYREHADLTEPWHISALVESPEEMEIIQKFNDHHSREDNGLAVVDAVEIKLATPAEVDDILDVIPEDIYPFFEIPTTTDPRGFVAALAGNSCAAKVRTGGTSPDAIPTPAQVAAFMHACTLTDVPFKATAGLHHPIRAEYALTYEKDAPRAIMHGFLNIFVAAALLKHGHANESLAREAIEETNAKAFIFTEDGLSWRNHVLDATQIAHSREAFSLTFGSCSFDEPVEDLKKLALL